MIVYCAGGQSIGDNQREIGPLFVGAKLFKLRAGSGIELVPAIRVEQKLAFVLR